MNTLLSTVGWDVLLQWRHRIIGVALFLATAYTVGLYLLQSHLAPETVLLIVFSDPIMMGFIFTGVMILFERESGTLQALAVCPLPRRWYLWSKAISLTLIALPVAVAIIAMYFSPGVLQWCAALYSTALSSFLLVFWGIVGVARVRTFNQYIIVIPLFLLPLCLPLLTLFLPATAPWFSPIPTQATLILLQALCRPLQGTEVVYALVYLPLHVWLAYKAAARTFTRYITEAS